MSLLRLLALHLLPLSTVCATSMPTTPADSYAIVCTPAVWQDAEWKAVIGALYAKHGKDSHAVVGMVLSENPESGNAADIASSLRAVGARYAVFVMKPGEIGRKTVSTLHRATRMLDDDPWGDCMWGIITGASAQDALRLANTSEPLVIKRLLATTNVHHAPFEHSCCITDWTNAPVREQSGYAEPGTQEFPETAGREHVFAEQLATQKPQLIVTSSHATQFNLEMPFGKGLIFPAGGRFHQLTAQQMKRFGRPLSAALEGKCELLEQLGKATPAIEPDGEARVWLAAGNCLIGNTQHSSGSMVVTALSAYSCKQFVGYTIPTWYGKGGWGTLSLFMESTDGISLAEAWYLNNQFILHETMGITPELMKVELNTESMDASFFRQMGPVLESGKVSREQARDALGLVHDRDVVAFYGDPLWRASIDNSHCARPLRIEWVGEKSFTITAGAAFKGRAAVWFPHAAAAQGATGCDAPGAVFTNDFILFPALELQAGETHTVTIH